MASYRLVAAAAVTAAAAADCNVASRVDCGYVGIDQQQCEAKGCCWRPLTPNPGNEPWCYYSSQQHCTVNLDGRGVGFTDAFYKEMMARYAGQLDVQGSGAVVAAPDQATPGGSYYYHWMRDGALSMWTYMTLHNNTYSAVEAKMSSYTRWVQRAQQEYDPNVDVLVEPKFNIPDGSPFTGGWCRPQTDGPGLRANTLVAWAGILLQNGREADVRGGVYPLVQKDLAWVVANWASDGCDLWEEVHSTDFFWNRMGFVYSLRQAAALARGLGDAKSASTYAATADAIHATLRAHWSGSYLFESTNRRIDGAVIHAVASFGGSDPDFGVLSSKVASTLDVYTETFCGIYELNAADTAKGVPGVLVGRYPGDRYAGGNPWQLLTAALAQVYYKAAQAIRAAEAGRGAFALAADEHVEWKRHLSLAADVSSKAFAAAAVNAGDAVMTRLWTHVQNDGGRIDEQIDRASGAQVSAKSLTWSYANILAALHLRQSL